MIEVDKEDLKLFIEPKALSLLTKVSDFLTKQGVKSYLVGGFVRDVLLGRDTADIDIAVAADALEIAPKVATALGGRYVLLDEVNRVGRVVLADQAAPSAKGRWQLDFSTFKGSIKHDLARRDFTIDAMAVNLGKGLKKRGEAPLKLPIIDPFNGWNDLERGVIRAVSGAAFKSDAVRLLRAVRLAAELGFGIDNETEALIRGYCPLIAGVAGERVREELLRLLATSRVGQFLTYLNELGLVTAMIPELNQAKGVNQPKEHFWDVLEHSLKTVAAVDFLLRRGAWEYANDKVLAIAPWSAELSQHFALEVSSGSTRGLLLKLAALLHDIAKPQTKAIDAHGRMRFLGHAKEGAAIAVNILERLRFSGKEVKLVEVMVRHHLRPLQMSQNELPTHRAIYRYFRDTGEAGIDILFLSLADHLATIGPNLNLAQWQKHAQTVEYILSQRFEQESLVIPPKLVDGHDLINIFGLSPGPKIGEILEAVREAQAAGELATRQEALAYIRRKLATKEIVY
ncbi:MAG: HD domain-containing protein [Dehalococcoidales bacterium]|nr:HD domain-containing protein [Dehalococcoidales bacterium]